MDKHDKADVILENGKIKILSDSERFLFFEIIGKTDKYLTLYHKQSKYWTCTCRSFIFNPEVECSHVLAAKEYVGGVFE